MLDDCFERLTCTPEGVAYSPSKCSLVLNLAPSIRLHMHSQTITPVYRHRRVELETLPPCKWHFDLLDKSSGARFAGSSDYPALKAGDRL